MKLASLFPWGYRLVFGNAITGSIVKSIIGFANKRSMPEISSMTWEKWFKNHFKPTVKNPQKSVYLFIDELLNYNEAEIGITTVKLLDKLGYGIKYLPHVESGRSFLSKGMLEEARTLARKNVALYKDLISADTPLIGVEPSAILTFRDEYPDLLRGTEKESAKHIAANTFMIEEFLSKALDEDKID